MCGRSLSSQQRLHTGSLWDHIRVELQDTDIMQTEKKIHFSLQITLSHKRKVCCFSPYLHNDPATSFAANADVEVDAGVCHFCG